MVYGDEPRRPWGSRGISTLRSSNPSHRHDQAGDLPRGYGPTAKEAHNGPRPEGLFHRIGSGCTMKTAGEDQEHSSWSAGTPRSALHGDLGREISPGSHYASTVELSQRWENHLRGERYHDRYYSYRQYWPETTRLVIRGKRSVTLSVLMFKKGAAGAGCFHPMALSRSDGLLYHEH
jgi:hypothetical protein